MASQAMVSPKERVFPEGSARIVQIGPPKPVHILVINPNSNRDMSIGIGALIEGQDYPLEHALITTFTASSGPSSIDNPTDALASAKVICSDIATIPEYFTNKDAFIVACYSPHPLVFMLRDRPSLARRPVVGIFEASISLSLGMLPISVPSHAVSLPPVAPNGPARTFTGTKFGIVTTGGAWVPVLTAGVNEYLGLPARETSQSTKFKGVESTGLSAEQLHSTPQAEVRERMIRATRRMLADGDVAVIVLGCAGMAGMDEWVKEACVEELGEQAASLVRVVDGVKAAVALVLEEARQAKQLAIQEKLTNTYINLST